MALQEAGVIRPGVCNRLDRTAAGSRAGSGNSQLDTICLPNAQVVGLFGKVFSIGKIDFGFYGSFGLLNNVSEEAGQGNLLAINSGILQFCQCLIVVFNASLIAVVMEADHDLAFCQGIKGSLEPLSTTFKIIHLFAVSIIICIAAGGEHAGQHACLVHDQSNTTGIHAGAGELAFVRGVINDHVIQVVISVGNGLVVNPSAADGSKGLIRNSQGLGALDGANGFAFLEGCNDFHGGHTNNVHQEVDGEAVQGSSKVDGQGQLILRNRHRNAGILADRVCHMISTLCIDKGELDRLHVGIFNSYLMALQEAGVIRPGVCNRLDRTAAGSCAGSGNSQLDTICLPNAQVVGLFGKVVSIRKINLGCCSRLSFLCERNRAQSQNHGQTKDDA